MNGHRVNRWAVDAPLTGVAVERSGHYAAFAGGDGCVRTLHLSDSQPTLRVHELTEGAVLALSLDCDVAGFLCGADDGAVYRLNSADEPQKLVQLDRSWPDKLVSHPSGLRAIADGAQVLLLDASGQQLKALQPHPSTVAGLGFSADGGRLAVSHYNGVTLWPLDEQEREPQMLSHRGSHLNVSWSRSGHYIATTTQEKTVHVWDLVTGRDASLGPSIGTIKSLNWSADGMWLLASGADTVSAWPFVESCLPPAAPGMLGRHSEYLIGQVCAHPHLNLAAAGYNDGGLELVSLARKPKKHCLADAPGSALVGLAWSPEGDHLLGGRSDGQLFAYRFDADWLAGLARPAEAV